MGRTKSSATDRKLAEIEHRGRPAYRIVLALSHFEGDWPEGSEILMAAGFPDAECAERAAATSALSRLVKAGIVTRERRPNANSLKGEVHAFQHTFQYQLAMPVDVALRSFGYKNRWRTHANRKRAAERAACDLVHATIAARIEERKAA